MSTEWTREDDLSFAFRRAGHIVCRCKDTTELAHCFAWALDELEKPTQMPPKPVFTAEDVIGGPKHEGSGV